MKFKLMIVFGLMALIASGISLQADFIQCLGGDCDGTDLANIVNGSGLFDSIDGLDGDDVIFGNDGPDFAVGNNGNDIVLGGAGSDEVRGELGNDILFAGPDDGVYSQAASGSFGNDSIFTFASETSTCLFIRSGEGQDTANLIGFGPYSAQHPFGQTDPIEGFILEVDPIAGGNVLIRVIDTIDVGITTIHGLTSPNVTIIPLDDPIVENCPELEPRVED